MESTSAEAVFNQVVDSADRVLKPLGYKRRALNFRRIDGGYGAIINVQRDKNNTSTWIRFTVNTGVICGALLREGRAISDASEDEAQIRRRIGGYTRHGLDKWWVVTASTKPDGVIAELSRLLEEKAAPFLEAHLTSAPFRAALVAGRFVNPSFRTQEELLAAFDRAESKDS